MKHLTVVVCLLTFIAVLPASAHQDPFAKKNPVIASTFSLLMVGGGQFYNDQYKKGAMFYMAGLIGSGMFFFSAMDDYNHGYDKDDDNGQGVLGLIIWGVAMTASSFEAYHAAKKINTRLNLLSLHGAEFTIEPYTPPKAHGAVLSLRF